MGNEYDRDGGKTPKKPRKNRFKETSKRLREGKETHLGHRASLDWRIDQSLVCDVDQEPYEIVPLEELKETLMASKTASVLLEEADAEGLEVHYDMQIPLSQYYPCEGKPVITLNPYHPKGDLLNLLTRELRHAWQHRQGALVNPLNFSPDDAILVNRAQSADVLMMTIKVAWELKLIGDADAWNWLLGSPTADMGRVFEIKAQSDFRTLNSGEASRVTYDKFFEDIHTKQHDKRIIHQMLLDETGYMNPLAPPPTVSIDLFKKLGEMPDGKNYLSMSSAPAPVDDCYTVVEDRSNANFLWFIKFERSFQEKELQMLEESVRRSAEIVDFAKWSLQHNLPADDPDGGA